MIITKIMRNDNALMSYVARQQENCEFSLKAILRKEDDSWKSFFMMLELVKKGTREEVVHDYGGCVLTEKLLNVNEGLAIIANLHPKDGDKGRILIPDYGEFAVVAAQPCYSVSSRRRYGILEREWPMRLCSFRVREDQSFRGRGQELLKEGLPYYPDLIEAAIVFFGLAVDHFDPREEIYVVVPDYRAQIESLRLVF